MLEIAKQIDSRGFKRSSSSASSSEELELGHESLVMI